MNSASLAIFSFPSIIFTPCCGSAIKSVKRIEGVLKVDKATKPWEKQEHLYIACGDFLVHL